MKILWICGTRILGGAERVTLHLAALLRARGHTVDALCPPDGAPFAALVGAGLVGHPARLGGALNAQAAVAIRRALDALAPDIALVTTADEWVWACVARRRRQRTRLVLVRHMALPLNWRVRWLASRRADAVVAVSQAVRASLLGRLGVRPDRVHVIYNPVRFPPRASVPDAQERARARAALSLPQDGRLVGFFGGLHQSKGIRDVMYAVSRANERLGDTCVMVGGRSPDGHGAGWFAELAREFRLNTRARYVGQIERMDIALTAADVVLVATHGALSEALPATLLEAMACGTPVIGYATGGMIEAIGEGERAGRLARADDVNDLARTLIEVLADPTNAERTATAALAHVRSMCDSQQAADRYERLFAALG